MSNSFRPVINIVNMYVDTSKADVAATDTESYTPLMLAAVAGHVEAFNVLLRRGSAIDETDEDGKTVVHLAAEENRVEILMVILLLLLLCVHWLCCFHAYIHTHIYLLTCIHTYIHTILTSMHTYAYR